LTAAENGHTLVGQRWHTWPNSLKYRILSKLLEIPAIHSKAIKRGFKPSRENLQAPTAI